MKIKAVLRTGKIYKNGQSPLMLRFTHDRNTKLVALGLSVEPHYWNKDAEMLTSDCPKRAILQSKIDSALAVYRKKINRLEALDVPVNFDTLFEPTTRKAGITIEDGFNAEIERLESLGKINSATKHKYALQVLDGYKSVKTALEAIDLDYLKGLELYLRQRVRWTFKPGRYSSREIKTKLQRIYDAHGLNKRATAAQIHEFCEARELTFRNKFHRPVRGYEIA